MQRASSVLILLWLSHCNTPARIPDCCCCNGAPAEQLQRSRRQGVSRAVACKGLPLRKVCSHLCHLDCQHSEGLGLQELVGTQFLINSQILNVVHRVQTFLPALASHQHSHHTVCIHFIKIFQNFQRISNPQQIWRMVTPVLQTSLCLHRMQCHLMACKLK